MNNGGVNSGGSERTSASLSKTKGGVNVRTWRVGTFSMGAALLLLGIYLLLSQLLGLDMSRIMMSWWPIILVVLGVEILLYLFLSRQEKPFLKYDFLSIFFVGILGTAGIGFAILSSSGILDKMDDVLKREERTMELPAFVHNMNNDVKRVVLQTERYPITVEGTTSKEISMFGTYRALTGKSEKLISEAEDYLSHHQKGDTLYISVKGLPSESIGPFDRYASLSATILIPADVQVEVIGNDNPITLKPRMLESDWTVDRASSLSVQIQEKSDINVTATGVHEVHGEQGKWKITEEQKQENQEGEYIDPASAIKNATYQTGKGSHHLRIMNSYEVNLNIVD